MRHETAHRVEALAPKEFSAYMSQLEGGSEAGYNTAVENARTAYRAATGRELPAELAHGEVAADLATNFLKDKNAIDRVRRLAENNPSVVDRMYNAVKDLKARVQSLGGRTYRDDATGMSFSYIELRNAERLYEVAIAQAARHSRDAVSTGEIVPESVKHNKDAVVFADRGVRYSVISLDNENPDAKTLTYIMRKNILVLQDEPDIFNVNKGEVGSADTAWESIDNYFESIGRVAKNPTIGIVDLLKKGAKTTAFHGIGKDKITAVAAIKDVIEKGIIVDYKNNWKTEVKIHIQL